MVVVFLTHFLPLKHEQSLPEPRSFRRPAVVFQPYTLPYQAYLTSPYPTSYLCILPFCHSTGACKVGQVGKVGDKSNQFVITITIISPKINDLDTHMHMHIATFSFFFPITTFACIPCHLRFGQSVVRGYHVLIFGRTYFQSNTDRFHHQKRMKTSKKEEKKSQRHAGNAGVLPSRKRRKGKRMMMICRFLG